jgi:RNA polymerase sigma factor (sigma-70 family)
LPETAAPSDDTDRVELRASVAAALRALPRRQRAVVVLRYFADLTEAQAAAAMGCSVGTVKSQTARALTRLRACPDLAGLITEEVAP